MLFFISKGANEQFFNWFAVTKNWKLYRKNSVLTIPEALYKTCQTFFGARKFWHIKSKLFFSSTSFKNIIISLHDKSLPDETISLLEGVFLVKKINLWFITILFKRSKY